MKNFNKKRKTEEKLSVKQKARKWETVAQSAANVAMEHMETCLQRLPFT